MIWRSNGGLLSASNFVENGVELFLVGAELLSGEPSVVEELLLLYHVHGRVCSQLLRWRTRDRRITRAELECGLLLDDDVAWHRALLVQRCLVERLCSLRQDRVVLVEQLRV